MKYVSGFTYIEVILMVALMIAIGILASPFYGNFLTGQEVDNASEALKGSIAKARLYSMMGKEAGSWGVALDGNRIVLFVGDFYGARNQEFDEVYIIHDRVTISGLNEIVFERRTGTPNTEPTITISLSGNADVPVSHMRTIRLNAAGVVDEDI